MSRFSNVYFLFEVEVSAASESSETDMHSRIIAARPRVY